MTKLPWSLSGGRKLTKQKIMNFFKRYVAAHQGRPPTVREVAVGIGQPGNFGTISIYMWQLVEEGFLVNDSPRIPRSFILADPQPRPDYYKPEAVKIKVKSGSKPEPALP